MLALLAARYNDLAFEVAQPALFAELPVTFMANNYSCARTCDRTICCASRCAG